MKYFLLMNFLILAGCTKSYKLNEVNPETEKASALLVVSTELKQTEKSDDLKCTLTFKNMKNHEFRMEVGAGRKVSTWNIPMGRYRFFHVRCGLISSFEVKDFPEIKVSTQVAFLVGKINLNLVSKTQLEWEVENLNKDASKQIFRDLPDDIQGRLYSPYTLKKIDMRMLNTMDGGFRVEKFGKKMPKDSLVLGQVNFDSCREPEARDNPLRLGKLSYHVNVVKGVMNRITKEFDQNLFSTRFKSCLFKNLSKVKFEPKYNFDFKVSVSQI